MVIPPKERLEIRRRNVRFRDDAGHLSQEFRHLAHFRCRTRDRTLAQTGKSRSSLRKVTCGQLADRRLKKRPLDQQRLRRLILGDSMQGLSTPGKLSVSKKNAGGVESSAQFRWP